MGTGVELGRYPTYNQTFFQNPDIGTCGTSQNEYIMECETDDRYEAVYILPGKHEVMDSDSPRSSSSDESTDHLQQEVYFTENEVHEAVQEGSGIAVELDRHCADLPFDNEALVFESSEDSESTIYSLLPTTTDENEFTAYEVPMQEGDLLNHDFGFQILHSDTYFYESTTTTPNGSPYIPYNVVKEEVIGEGNGNCNSEGILHSSNVYESCGSVPYSDSLPSVLESPGHVTFDLTPTDDHDALGAHAYGYDYINNQFQQHAEDASEQASDPLNFGNNSDESDTDSSLASNCSRRNVKNRNGVTRKTKEAAKVPVKKLKSNGQKRTRTTRGSAAESPTSDTAVVKRGIDVNSLRYHVGPRLRYLSAVLEVTGVKYMADYLPYEIMRRFHPTNAYRTILKMIESPITSNVAFNNVFPEEPDWKEWELLTKLDEEANFEVENGTGTEPQRIYYKTPFGLDLNGKPVPAEDGSLLSIPKESEKDGKPTFSPSVISSVGSADLNVKLDLEGLASTCPNTEFQDINTPLIIRLREPKCCGLLYDTGKLIVVGAQSFDEFRKAARRFARMVQKSNYKVRLTNMAVHSYLGLAKLSFRINIAELVKHEIISNFAKHDPSVIPGAIMFMKTTSVLCLIFASGIIIMTDATNDEEMKKTLDKIYPCLRLFGY